VCSSSSAPGFAAGPFNPLNFTATPSFSSVSLGGGTARVFVLKIRVSSLSGRLASSARAGHLASSSFRSDCGSTPSTTTERLVARMPFFESRISPRRAVSGMI